MSRTKPNGTCDALQFDPYAIPQPGLALQCVQVREERPFPSALLFGAHGLSAHRSAAEESMSTEPGWRKRGSGVTRPN